MSNAPMALARAFTKRTKRPEVAPLPVREGSVRYPTGTIRRDQISLPTELLSTTNVHALTAPNIRKVSNSSSNSSLRSGSGSDSDFSSIDKSFLASPMTTPDTSSIESSPTTPEHRHRTSFFDDSKPKRAATTAANSRASTETSNSDAPAIPQRALSHSKYAHQELARKRSISRMAPPPTSMPSANVIRSSTDFFNGGIDPSHPFGRELAQVNEVAEDFGGVSAVLDEEEAVLMSKGLQKFGVEDYINEIQGMYGGIFEDRLAPSAWI